MKSKHCKNCGRPVTDQYCSHCGQKTKVDRITFLYIWHEFFQLITHIEEGFFFTSRRMLTAPGKSITEFIEGKRKIYQSPVSYFSIWTASYILLLYWFEITFGENTVISYKEYFGPTLTTSFAISHLSFVLMIVIPFQALYLFLLVTRKKYNYFETLVPAIYVMGTIIMLQFAFAVAALLIHIITSESVNLSISDSLKAGYLIWFTFNFIKQFPVKAKFLRGLLFIILAFGTFTLWRLYGVPAVFNWFFSNRL